MLVILNFHSVSSSERVTFYDIVADFLFRDGVFLFIYEGSFLEVNFSFLEMAFYFQELANYFLEMAISMK
jgi:hypothetical protein